jgi:hypothetical protein
MVEVEPLSCCSRVADFSNDGTSFIKIVNCILFYPHSSLSLSMQFDAFRLVVSCAGFDDRSMEEHVYTGCSLGYSP